MIQDNKPEFDKLSSNLGKKVLVEYTSNQGQYLTEGTLLEINPFEYIKLEKKKIPFIGSHYSIKTILDTNSENLYHNPFIILHPRTEEESNWIKYFSGFLDEDLEKEENNSKHNLIEKIRVFDEKKSFIKTQGGKVIKPPLRNQWNQLCNYKHLLLYSLEPALEVMQELNNGFHKELSNIREKYNLSGYQFNIMVNAINLFSTITHPEVEHHSKWLNQLKKIK